MHNMLKTRKKWSRLKGCPCPVFLAVPGRLKVLKAPTLLLLFCCWRRPAPPPPLQCGATYLLHLCTSSRTVRVASSRAPADPSREEDGRVGEARSDV